MRISKYKQIRAISPMNHNMQGTQTNNKTYIMQIMRECKNKQ